MKMKRETVKGLVGLGWLLTGALYLLTGAQVWWSWVMGFSLPIVFWVVDEWAHKTVRAEVRDVIEEKKQR